MNENEFLEIVNYDFPQLQLAKNDLQHPTASTLRKYYVTMLEEVTRINPQELCGFTEAQIEFLKSGAGDAAMEQQIYSHNLYTAVKYIFDKIELFRSEFHYSDILFPYITPNRSFIFMNTMYDFFGSCAAFDEQYAIASESFEEKHKLIDSLKEEIQCLREQLDENKKSKLDFLESVKNLKAELTNYKENNEEAQLVLKDLQTQEVEATMKFRQVEDQEFKAQEELAKLDNEKKYFESLIVSDSSSMLEHHNDLMRKKEDSFKLLQEMEIKRRIGLSGESKLDKVLELQEMLSNVLKEPIPVAKNLLDLKGMNSTVVNLKSKKLTLDREESALLAQVRDKDRFIPFRQKEVLDVKAESDSVECAWKEREGHYMAHLDSLRCSLAEATQRLNDDHPTFQATREKIEQLNFSIEKKEMALRHEHQRQMALMAKFRNDLTQRPKVMKQKLESMKK